MKLKHKLLLTFVVLASLWAICYGIVGLIGTYKLSNGCLIRYSSTDPIATTKTSLDSREFPLRADGNYTFLEFTDTSLDANGQVVTTKKYGPDPNKYGQWFKVDVNLMPTQKVTLQVSGEVSLCRAYIPQYNIQQTSELDNTGNPIPIPRIEEPGDPIPLILDPKNSEWRNALELYQQDKLVVFLGKDQLPTKDSSGNIIADTNNVIQSNRFTNSNVVADCSENKTSYSPICGRYSPYIGNYLASCDMSACAVYRNECKFYGGYTDKIVDNTTCGDISNSDKAQIFANTGYIHTDTINYCYTYGVKDFASMPGYTSLSSYLSPRQESIPDLTAFETKYDTSWDCTVASNNATVNSPTYQNDNEVWFSSLDAAGLLYRFSTDINPADKATVGSDFSYSLAPSTDVGLDQYKHIFDTLITVPKTYLQYRLVNSSLFAANQSTGGYVLYVKQTKCRRENGEALTDELYTDRGRVNYLLLAGSTMDPNVDPSLIASAQGIGFDANGSFALPTNSTGYLWLKIDNNLTDYQQSFGYYNTKLLIETPIASGGFSFFTDILNLFKTKMLDLSTTIFKNMTCYQVDKGGCTNYFNYLRALMILYITTNGLMFLMGMVEINQKDLVIKVVKISIIAGLMNEQTFGYINSYFIPIITGSTDAIVANLDSLAIFASTTIVDNTSVVNPLTFIDELFSRIFLDPTFNGQLLALLSFGSHGFIYFILTVATLCIAVRAIFRAASIYIIAFVAQCLLIALAPFFLTFMLFDYTNYLFEKWLKYLIKYALEPIVVLVGIIIFVQLFTVYLDYLLSYSVCWKCALTFSLPFASIPGLENLAITKVPLFCINWFVPWGHDAAGAIPFGATEVLTSPNFTNVIALLIIAYGMDGYIDLASHLMARLSNTEGPSSIGTGSKMAASIGKNITEPILKKIGLDKKSRDAMIHMIEERIMKGNKAEKIKNSASDRLVNSMRKGEDALTDDITNKVFGKENYAPNRDKYKNMKKSNALDQSLDSDKAGKDSGSKDSGGKDAHRGGVTDSVNQGKDGKVDSKTSSKDIAQNSDNTSKHSGTNDATNKGNHKSINPDHPNQAGEGGAGEGNNKDNSSTNDKNTAAGSSNNNNSGASDNNKAGNDKPHSSDTKRADTINNNNLDNERDKDGEDPKK